jgi:hypothetical protein
VGTSCLSHCSRTATRCHLSEDFSGFSPEPETGILESWCCYGKNAYALEQIAKRHLDEVGNLQGKKFTRLLIKMVLHQCS